MWKFRSIFNKVSYAQKLPIWMMRITSTTRFKLKRDIRWWYREGKECQKLVFLYFKTFLRHTTILFELLSPPFSHFKQFLYEFFPLLRKTIAPFCFTFFYHANIDELLESIGKNFSVCFANSFSYISKAMSTMIDGIHNKKRPFFPNKRKERSSIRACTLRLFHHRKI